MNIKQTLIYKYLNDFSELFFPTQCAICNMALLNQEKVICTTCLYKIPRTNFHKTPSNSIEQSFWGRVNIERATAYFFFKKGSYYQKLLHKLKYKNQPEIGVELGKQFGVELKTESAFNNIDYIIPVPLHHKKLKKRGYNQSEAIAKGMSEFLNGELNTDLLQRTTFTQTQTKKNRFDRWQNVNKVFTCTNPQLIDNKHVLIIDDVLTTGATIEACVQALQQNSNVKVSIATLAFAGE